MAYVAALILLSGRDRVRSWLGQKWILFGTVAILGLLLTGSCFSIRNQRLSLTIQRPAMS